MTAAAHARSLVRHCHSLAALAVLPVCVVAQEPTTTGWMRPPEPIVKLIEAPPPPDASLSPQKHWIVLTTREALPGLDVVARPHLKLAGLRIDPQSHGPQLSTKVMSIALRAVAGGDEKPLAIPAGHWAGPIWSADDRAIALVRAAEGGGELWVADPATAPPRRVDGVRVNQVLGRGVQWMPDQRRLLLAMVLPGDPPPRPAVPAGPQVQESKKGEKAPVRTYQDLLQDAYDEALLDHYGRSALAIVDAASGQVTKIGEAGLWDRAEPSPDGSLLLATRIERPFSYVQPLSAFPRSTEVLDLRGQVVRVVAKAPLQETVPIGGVPTGPRGIDWLPLRPHTLVWTEALDGGDPRKKVPQRDLVVRLEEPTGTARPWFKTENRYMGGQYGGDGSFALVTEVDRLLRRQRVWQYDALDPAKPGVQLYERSMQDAYGDPGRPISERLVDGRSVVRMRGGNMFLAGDGASPQGNRAFVDRWDPASGQKERLFHAEPGRQETFVGFLDDGEQRLLVRSESPVDPPALVVIDRQTQQRTTLLAFPDATAELTKGIQKRLVTYEREDHVPLSGTLYLPPGYKDGVKLPCLIWAYPLEYSQASDAGQVRQTPNRHLRISGPSHLALLLAGYAVFDDAAMPIVGPQRTANDTFVTQIQQNARAAVAALDKQGCIDVGKLAVAGHSYGAFMTANLLAHTDLFTCGIARSGAYNRTLTPFGFQSEERTYWEAPEVYAAMSPFSYANKIEAPLLLIHGADDNNPGTFPMQSQRLFVALKGHGAVARLCILPNEAHGYAARENVLHCLAEMCAWLDRYCKGGRTGG
jgi:dipeptidyl aminopeptidase/acylaminoacyl peptidase